MSCVFTSARGHHERYYGTIRKFGLDIGATDRGVLAWAVFAPWEGPKRGALAGDAGLPRVDTTLKQCPGCPYAVMGLGLRYGWPNPQAEFLALTAPGESPLPRFGAG